MEGRNRYLNVPTGLYEEILRNEPESSAKKSLFESMVPQEGPCIFLSHKSEDKPDVHKIAKHILSKGIDIYLDSMDKSLQLAVSRKDDVAITKMIEIGLSSSTHLMVLLSDSTQLSWWVPYEIGFGKAENKDISSCIFKPIKYRNDLPSYLAITNKITTTIEMDNYLDNIRFSTPATKLANRLLESFYQPTTHALTGILE